MSSPSKRRDTDVLKLMMTDYKVSFSVEDCVSDFYVDFHGPSGTPYEEGLQKVHVTLPMNYPFKSPSIGFCNRIFHPNIDEASGSVCLDVINQTQSPMYDLINIFDIFLPQLLNYPNSSDPLNSEAATLYNNDKNAYEEKVRQYVKKFAFSSNTQRKCSSSSESNSNSKQATTKSNLNIPHCETINKHSSRCSSNRGESVGTDDSRHVTNGFSSATNKSFSNNNDTNITNGFITTPQSSCLTSRSNSLASSDCINSQQSNSSMKFSSFNNGVSSNSSINNQGNKKTSQNSIDETQSYCFISEDGFSSANEIASTASSLLSDMDSDSNIDDDCTDYDTNMNINGNSTNETLFQKPVSIEEETDNNISNEIDIEHSKLSTQNVMEHMADSMEIS